MRLLIHSYKHILFRKEKYTFARKLYILVSGH